MLVEALFSVLVGGLIGAISQQLRKAKPLWATALLICVGLPATFILAQLGIHHIAKTQHQSSGIVASALLGGLAAAYSWYAMRHGAMLGGTDETTIRHDMQVLPRITAGFLLVLPRALIAGYRQLRGPDR
jgi:peptidoglycan/LPS O-acetylase OafA/YrhL